MKSLTERLEWLRLLILDDTTGIKDPNARQAALDIWIETNAIAEALPEISIILPEIKPAQRRVPHRIIEIAPFDRVVGGGRSS